MIAQEAMRLKEAAGSADLQFYEFNLNLPAVSVLAAETRVAAKPETPEEIANQLEGWKVLTVAIQTGEVKVLEAWLESVNFDGHPVKLVHNTRLVPTVGFKSTSQLIVKSNRSLIL